MDGGGDDLSNSELGSSMTFPTKANKFNASKGWFDKFQRMFNHESVSLHGEADSAAGEYINEMFKNIIGEVGYLCEHVFNMDMMSLFWKWRPEPLDLRRTKITSQL